MGIQTDKLMIVLVINTVKYLNQECWGVPLGTRLRGFAIGRIGLGKIGYRQNSKEEQISIFCTYCTSYHYEVLLY